MHYRPVKKAGFNVSAVSFGCMSLKSTAKGTDALINEAVEKGITFFDTADLYEAGENEKLLGNALKSKRQSVHIATKVGNRLNADGKGWHWCPEKEYILSAVNDSLKRLQTDYIDLYMLHGGTLEDPVDEIIEAFERLTEQGKIRSYGISSIRPNVIREYVQKSNIAAVMTQYSLLDRRPEEQTLNVLQQNNVAVLARGTVAGGLLGGKAAKEYLGIPEKEVQQIVNRLAESSGNTTIAGAAIRYVLSNPAITTAVAGIRTGEQLNEALQAAASGDLDTEVYNLLKGYKKPITYQQHR